jgi:hypothetical protein
MKLLPTTKRLVIYPINLGTLLNISSIITTMDGVSVDGDKDLFEVGIKNIIQNKDKIKEISALAIINKKIHTPWGLWRKWRLMRYIDQNLSASELLKLMQLVIMQMGVTDFLASIVSVKRMNMTGAKNDAETSSTGGK